MTTILLIYDSRGGLTERLADSIEQGIIAGGATCTRKRIDDAVPADLLPPDGIIVGSPNWSGMTGKLKDWFDYSGDLWESGELAGKVGAAFTAGYSRSGGIEATLLQLLHLLFAHGMIIVGLPWTESMRRSGSYYGATAHGAVTGDDEAQAYELGRRVAEFAARLAT
ncbi:MAG TPA: NAD(P)H-dependent oxidoreductase [Tepidiformaceae bacterium]|nr:NAD(P)H-dependent oxidoreductase [Tepidiformaceae bacterium]